jgi:uncharacterized protein YjbI with pentapeptide repeats
MKLLSSIELLEIQKQFEQSKLKNDVNSVNILTDLLHNVKIHNCIFPSIDSSEIESARDSYFQNVTFYETIFYGINGSNSKFENCIFSKCSISKSDFFNTVFLNCVFVECSLSRNLFHEVTIDNCIFSNNTIQRFTISNSNIRKSIFVGQFDESIKLIENKLDEVLW